MNGPQLAFVVGTGRCGSTVLGNLLAARPDLATVNEYLTTGHEGLADTRRMTAGALVAALRRSDPVLTLLIRHGLEPAEVRYPLDRPRSRFSRQTGVPGVLLAALPAVAADPDAAWDDLCSAARTWQTADAADRYRRLAGWFARRTGASVVVERSGGSLRFVPRLVRSFPEARFVHIHRDGVATARSMARHTYFQMSVLRRDIARSSGHDLFDPTLDEASRQDLDALVPGLTPWAFDPDVLAARPPVDVETFGGLWSSLLYAGVRSLRAMPADQVLHLDYAELCADPPGVLEAVTDFLGLPQDRDWALAAGGSVRTPPPSADRRGDAALRRACALGDAVRRSLGGPVAVDRARAAACR